MEAREDVADLFANDGVTSISMVFHDDCIYAYDHLGHTASDEVGKEVIKKIERKIYVLKTDGTVVNTIVLDNNSGTAYLGDEKYMFFAKTGGELVYIDKKDILGGCEFKKAENN